MKRNKNISFDTNDEINIDFTCTKDIESMLMLNKLDNINCLKLNHFNSCKEEKLKMVFKRTCHKRLRI